MTAHEWLSALGVMMPSQSPGQDAIRGEGAGIASLCRAFGPSVFCPDSLKFVAEKVRFWPSAGEVYQRLSEWRRYFDLNAPRPVAPLALRAPERPKPTPEEIEITRKEVERLQAETGEHERAHRKLTGPHSGSSGGNLSDAQLVGLYEAEMALNESLGKSSAAIEIPLRLARLRLARSRGIA